MLLVPTPSAFEFTFDNWGANPSTTPGVLLTSGGTANTEGSWVQIASSSDTSRDCQLVSLHFYGGAVSTSQRDFLADIGIDLAGGTSYTAVVSNMICGSSGTTLPGTPFRFPLYIPAGASVAVRVQSNTASAQCRVVAKFLGTPTNPEIIMPRCGYCETIGTVTNSGGVSFTPGNAADGTWTLLGTTSRFLWWWQLGFQVSTSNLIAETIYVDLGYGDGTNFNVVQHALFSLLGNEQQVNYSQGNLSVMDCVCPLPSGTSIYVRGRCPAAPSNSGNYNALAYGMA